LAQACSDSSHMAQAQAPQHVGEMVWLPPCLNGIVKGIAAPSTAQRGGAAGPAPEPDVERHPKASALVDLAALPTMDELPAFCVGGGQAWCREISSDGGETPLALVEGGAPPPRVAEEIDAMTLAAASAVRPFASSGLEWVRTLQEAPNNHGFVEMMRVVSTGRFVAVKRMPNSYVRAGPDEFALHSADSLEQPWFDVGLNGYLHAQGFQHACEPLGIFRDHEFTYVSSAFCSGGDLFGLMLLDPSPGEARENLIRPIMLQVFVALRWLHSRGIAHLDISLENILLGGECESEVKLIDFGLSTLNRTCLESGGKRSYIAPEMLRGPYDPFDSDAFAAGVVLFSLASRMYP